MMDLTWYCFNLVATFSKLLHYWSCISNTGDNCWIFVVWEETLYFINCICKMQSNVHVAAACITCVSKHFKPHPCSSSAPDLHAVALVTTGTCICSFTMDLKLWSNFTSGNKKKSQGAESGELQGGNICAVVIMKLVHFHYILRVCFLKFESPIALPPKFRLFAQIILFPFKCERKSPACSWLCCWSD